MDNIKDIIKDYQIKKEGRSLPSVARVVFTVL